jgi:hypothetical protein
MLTAPHHSTPRAQHSTAALLYNPHANWVVNKQQGACEAQAHWDCLSVLLLVAVVHCSVPPCILRAFSSAKSMYMAKICYRPMPSPGAQLASGGGVGKGGRTHL